MPPLPDPALPAVEAALTDFPWSNYGLDDVDEADTEWAADLAQEVVKAVRDADRETVDPPVTP